MSTLGGERGRGDGPGYLASLSEELDAAHVGGARKRRILAEFADHLGCDPRAELGDPALIARQFADELGTAYARRAALRGFAALAVAGLLIVVWAAAAARHYGAPRLVSAGAGLLAVGVCAVAAQVAFVAGGLGLLRALRLRRESVIAADEARVLTRRAGVGLLAGAIALLAIVPIAHDFPGTAQATVRLVGFVISGVGLAAILLASPSVLAASRLTPQQEGDAGDLFSDIGPLVPPVLADAPWRFAISVAGALALVLAVGGMVGSDPYDGIMRGLAEGAACLAGFALLGRYLGLREHSR
jgi:hypothetical protein